MDFPTFHLDWMGNRLLIAVIATVHVVVTHAMAVGALPLVTLLEWRGYHTCDDRWDHLAFRIFTFCFVVTTSVGALTGVGIWFAVALVNPHAIGSLLRIFFWAWFTEWLLFTIEVGLILAYYLTWKHGTWTHEQQLPPQQQKQHKRRHILLGGCLSIASLLAMMIVVAILSFMMDPGEWPVQRSFWTGVFNPIYVPQLAFRMPLAMLLAGLFTMLLIPFFTSRDDFRSAAMRWAATWTLAWSLPCMIAALIYWQAIPTAMKANWPTALTTQAFISWHVFVVWTLAIAAVMIVAVAVWASLWPKRTPRVTVGIALITAVILMGSFERVREFIRKPAVIPRYMYANGIEINLYPLLAEQGVLTHATYVNQQEITPENRLLAGRDMFRIACSRCHTTAGINGITQKVRQLYEGRPPEHDALLAFIRTMHNVRPFMPPAPGTEAELSALTDYIIELQRSGHAWFRK